MSFPRQVQLVGALLASCMLLTGPVSRADDAKESPPTADTSQADQEFRQALGECPSPSGAEARTFAEAVAEVIYIPNPQVWQGIVDWDKFLVLAFTGIEVHPHSEKGFRQGFLGNLNTQNGFFGQIHRSLGDFGTYELVRVHEVDGRQRALFRLINGDGGLNYHDYILYRDDQGRPRAVDIYIYLTGEPLSTTIRRMIRQLAVEEKRGFFDRLAGKQQDFLKGIEALGKMTQSIQRGDADGALKIYHSLPAELKQDKSLLIQRYTAAAMLTEEDRLAREITATMDVFRDAYPQDACLDFMALDYHLARKEFDRTLEAVDRLDKAVGGDPFLHEIRGNVHYQSGQIDKALQQYEFAIAALPDRGSAYLSLIGIALEQKDHAATLAGLKRLDQAVVMAWNDFREVPEYAGFVASPFFEQWTEYLESKPAP